MNYTTIRGLRSAEIVVDGVSHPIAARDFAFHTDGNADYAGVLHCFEQTKTIKSEMNWAPLNKEFSRWVHRQLARQKRLARALTRASHQVANRRVRQATRWLRQHFTSRSRRHFQAFVARLYALGATHVRLEFHRAEKRLDLVVR